MLIIAAMLLLSLQDSTPTDPAQLAREAREAEAVANEDLWAEEPAARVTPAPTAVPPTRPVQAAAPPSRQRLICRSRPALGSRVTMQRTCRTAEEWRINDHDLEQSRRDINDRGAVGCDMRYSFGEC